METSLSQRTLNGYQVTLRPVLHSDLETLRAWRNSPEVSEHMLSQSTINQEQQLAWFKKVQRDPSQAHFIISYRGEDIGSSNIKSRLAGETLEQARVIEPGLYIADPRYRGNILAFSPTLLINDFCFETLGCKKLVAVVKSTNQAALKYNQKLGYKVVKQGELIEIELNFEDYQQHSKVLKRLLSRERTR
ncbi:GNAT family N-acetyltransferase [Aliiglaciecola sp. M165]|uniref:GNAT family N-acetyltransferase n=1 Tax=Aliiglaciecola sp. M165 TaxID=2593649 RepID=UPI00163D437B|nr:GNAT family N-acetyltransferase [Aliiglaciecola sp. M165]